MSVLKEYWCWKHILLQHLNTESTIMAVSYSKIGNNTKGGHHLAHSVHNVVVIVVIFRRGNRFN